MINKKSAGISPFLLLLGITFVIIIKINPSIVASASFLLIPTVLIMMGSYFYQIETQVIIISLFCNMGVIFDVNSFYMPGFFKFRDLMFLFTFLPVFFSSQKVKSDTEIKKFVKFFLAFTFFYIFISNVISFAGNTIEILKSILYWRFLFFWIAIIPVYRLIKQSDNYERALHLMVNISFYISILILIQYFFPQVRISTIVIEELDAYVGGYANYNFIIPGWGYLVLFQLIGLGLFILKAPQKYLGLSIYFMMALIILLSSGRTALVKMIVSTILFVIFLSSNSSSRITPRLFVLFVFGTLFVIIDSFTNSIGILRFVENLVHSGTLEMQYTEGTWAIRVLSLPNLWNLFLSNPLFGNGILDVVEMHSQSLINFAIVDNGLIGVLVLYGAVGTLILFFPYFRIIALARKTLSFKYFNNNYKIGFEKIFICALSAQIITQMLFYWTFTANAFRNFEGMYLFGVYIAFFVESVNRIKKSKNIMQMGFI
ncbi:MAG: O-antigen ligase family protein [Ignavibacteriaceae bacterium]|jgi:hypothetical protein